MWRALEAARHAGRIGCSTAQANQFFSVPVSIIRRRAELPPPAPGQPGPFSSEFPSFTEMNQATVYVWRDGAALEARDEVVRAYDSIRSRPTGTNTCW